MTLLDLDTHDIEDLPGKEVVFNGVRYELLERIGEGGQAWVYPLRNCRTRLIQFVGKLYKCSPASPEGADVRKRMSGNEPSMAFQLKLIGIDRAVSDELYEFGGGLFRLQRLVAGVHDPEGAFQIDRMKYAAQLVSENKFAEAVTVYNSVLSDNPNHTVALGNKALCMASDELSPEALLPLLQAIELEPNDTELVVRLVELYESLRWPQKAIAAVEQSLKLWRWRFDVWTAGIEVALKWDFVDYATEALASVQATAPRAEILRGYSERLVTSRERAQRFEEAMTQALQCLQQEDFVGAEVHLERAVAASARNELGRANLAVCKFHLGSFDEAQGLILPLLTSELALTNPTVAMLSILALYSAGRAKTAAQLVELLDDNPVSLSHLPCVPVAILASGALEYESVSTIVEMLEGLAEVEGVSLPRVQRLTALYRQYEHELSRTAG